MKEFKREIELTLTLKPEKQVPEFLVLQTGSKINDQPGEVLFKKKVLKILDLNDRAVCHVLVSKGAHYYIIKWAEYHR